MSAPDTTSTAARHAREAFVASRRRLYVERSDKHAALDRFVCGADSPHRLLVVTGEAGAGKSALLANWCRAYRDAHTGTVVIDHYVGATSIATDHVELIRQVIAEIAERTGAAEPLPSTPEEIEESFPFWLARLSSESIVVLDALDELAVASHSLAWLPSWVPPSVRVIVSTRSEAMVSALEQRGCERLDVAPLEREQRLAILREHVAAHPSAINEAQIARLAEPAIAANPLFLCTGAQSVIAASGGDVAGVIDRYLAAGNLAELFAHVLERVEQSTSPRVCENVVSHLAFARRGLLVDELCALTRADRDAVAAVLAHLEYHTVENAGVIGFSHDQFRRAAIERYVPEQERVDSFHRLLGMFFLTRELPRRVVEEPWQFLKANDGDGLERSLTDRAMVVALSEDPTQHELLRYWRAIQARSAPIDTIYRAALKRWRAQRPSDDELLDAIDATGDLLTKLGMFDAAREFFTTALDDGRESAPVARRVATMRRLALLDYHARKLDDAERTLRDALELLAGAGDRPASTSITDDVRADLASVLAGKGDLDEAVEMLRALHAGAAERADARAEAEFLNNLGTVYKQRGELDAAASHFMRALELNERRFGRWHPDVARNLVNLAITEHARGAVARAVERARDAADIFTTVLGPDHPSTANSLAILANALFDRGDYDEAIALLERALEATRAAFGPRDLRVANLLANIASVRFSGPHPRTAGAAYEECLSIRTEILGPDHPATIAIRRRHENFNAEHPRPGTDSR
jgi:tetratricopeptide (TPR) repeat protein